MVFYIHSYFEGVIFMSYTQTQWLLLFFRYCLLGWLWETAYVSLRRREWVNRGFLYGPWLPIYGGGAIVVLFVTLPVAANLPLVFLLGMLSATALEYVTGAVMERLFHMRYWDYSNQPLNVNGYVCLPVSLAWGGFSLLMVEFLHPPIDRFILRIPSSAAEAAALLLAVLFTVDVTCSVRSALDTKALLARLEDGKELLKQADLSLQSAIENLLPQHEGLGRRLEEMQEAFSRRRELFEQSKENKNRTRKAFLYGMLREQRSRKSTLLTSMQKYADAALNEISGRLQQNTSEPELQRLTGMQNSLQSFRSFLHEAELNLAARKDAEYRKALSILRRNPSSMSHRYKKAFAELADLKKLQSRRKEK